MIDFQVKRDFKYNKFSRLEYLSKKESWNKDDFNLGIYYFMLERKGEPTDFVFNEILVAKGGYTPAYNYLGDVACRLFDDQEEKEISSYYYKQGLMHSDTDSHSYWGLFCSTADPYYFFQSIVINYECKEFKKITNKMHRVFVSDLINANFGQKDWEVLKSICLDDRIEGGKEALLICYFHLAQYEEGVNLIKSEDSVSLGVAELYRNHGCINDEVFLKSISYYERLKFIEMPELAYEEIKKEAKKGNSNPTQEVIIKYAFEAKAYNDVIKLVERKFEKDQHHLHENVLKLYHSLSSIYLDLSLNDDFERDINSKNYFGDNLTKDDESLPLYLAYLILKNVNKLKVICQKQNDLYDLTYSSLYKKIKANLSHESLIGHCLYNSLIDIFNDLKEQWHKKQVENELNSAKKEKLDSERIASILMAKGEYREALDILLDLNPSMSVYNYIGVCFEHIGDWCSALENAKLALEAMLSSGEKNSTIISNYLYCLPKSGTVIDSELYESYIEMFNKSLSESFKYNRILAENRKSLFKYYPFNKFTLDALINGYFYLASAEQLNDPIELPYDNLTKDNELVILRPHFRLSSFSNNENSMLMWSHYAENHTGLMIEYCFEGALPDGVGIGTVQYPHVEERFIGKDKYLFNQYMLTKNKDWAYEKEVRLFGYRRNKVYYEKLVYPKRSSNAAAYVKSITVGYKFPESTIKLVQSIVSTLNEGRNKNLPQIVLRRAKLSNNNFFALDYEEIRLESSSNTEL